jgi:ferrochelatase
MADGNDQKYAVILLGMGGPESGDDVREYLCNIFSDRSIIRLPGGALLQKPFAHLISAIRSGKVRKHYDLIGGGSPLLKWTRAQAEQLEHRLADHEPGAKCYVGMRYFRPTIEDAVVQARDEGFRRIVFLPMYPQYCRATTGSSFQMAREVTEKMSDLELAFIDEFHDHPEYIALLRRYISDNIRSNDALLFSAHSIPQKFVEEGDPYVDQVRGTARLTAGEREYHVSFQSRTGPVKWVGPDTVTEVERLLTSTDGDILIVPIAFVCDHIETLYEIDIELRQLLGVELAQRIRRLPMFNDDLRFTDVLADVVRKKVGAHVRF